jgi:hypothetical protein
MRKIAEYDFKLVINYSILFRRPSKGEVGFKGNIILREGFYIHFTEGFCT